MQSWLAKSVVLVESLARCRALRTRRPRSASSRSSRARARLLRGATWYKLVAGTRVEEGDIVEVVERAQVQIEFTAGTAANLVGAGSIYVAPAKAGAARARAAERLAQGRGQGARRARAHGAVRRDDRRWHRRDARARADRRESLSRPATRSSSNCRQAAPTGPRAKRSAANTGPSRRPARSRPCPRAPQAFVDAMPRHFVDPLPALAARIKSKPRARRRSRDHLRRGASPGSPAATARCSSGASRAGCAIPRSGRPSNPMSRAIRRGIACCIRKSTHPSRRRVN